MITNRLNNVTLKIIRRIIHQFVTPHLCGETHIILQLKNTFTFAFVCGGNVYSDDDGR